MILHTWVDFHVLVLLVLTNRIDCDCLKVRDLSHCTCSASLPKRKGLHRGKGNLGDETPLAAGSCRFCRFWTPWTWKVCHWIWPVGETVWAWIRNVPAFNSCTLCSVCATPSAVCTGKSCTTGSPPAVWFCWMYDGSCCPADTAVAWVRTPVPSIVSGSDIVMEEVVVGTKALALHRWR